MFVLLPVTLIIYLFSLFSDAKYLRGKVYARMELCQLPRVTLRTTDNGTTALSHSIKRPIQNATTNSSTPTHPSETLIKKDTFFHIDLSDVPMSGSTVIQIEAECPPVNVDQSPLRATYSLDTAKIDWKGAHELLLFNDVSVLAFGYTEEQ